MEFEQGFTHNRNNNNDNGIYIGISPQHMEFKATDITKLDAEWMLAHKKSQRSWVGSDPQQKL